MRMRWDVRGQRTPPYHTFFQKESYVENKYKQDYLGNTGEEAWCLIS